MLKMLTKEFGFRLCQVVNVVQPVIPLWITFSHLLFVVGFLFVCCLTTTVVLKPVQEIFM